MIEPGSPFNSNRDNGSYEAAPLPPHPALTQYYADERNRHSYVIRSFDASASHYDWINQIMSFGTGHLYRRQALLRAGLAVGMHVLDVGCGTGVIANHAAHIVGSQGCVIALDPSIGMLQEAIRRRVRPAILGVGERLPFADNHFDMLTMGYALRHVADLGIAFREYRRVLKPGGTVLLLEITLPTFPPFYNLLKLYLKWIIPALAGLFRRSREARGMMMYFWDTIERCVPPETIIAVFQSVGFKQVKHYVAGRIFSEYTARKG